MAISKKVIEEVRSILIDVAMRGQTISYSGLVEKLTTVHLSHRSPALFEILEEISKTEYEAGRGMLSVVVGVGAWMPGDAFFPFARKIGLQGNDKEIYDMQLKHVHTCWKNNQPIVSNSD